MGKHRFSSREFGVQFGGTWIFGLDWISTLGLGRQAF
jgi:hypothetical protein